MKGLISTPIVGVALMLVCAQSIAAEDKPKRELSALEIKIGRLLPGAAPASLSVSPDGKRIAFFRKSISGKKWSVVVDDVQGKPFDAVGKINPLFSPDSQRVAHVATRARRKLVVVDGVEGKEYNEVGGITFSFDSKRLAYMASEGAERLIVVDGIEQPLRFDALNASGPIFSPDSQRVGYAARRGAKWLVVIDGIEGKEYDGAGGLVFAPDSQQWAHFANRGAKSLVILNGVESADYDGILRDTRLVFTTPHTVEALVHRNLEIARVVFTDLLK
jgi:dipeptidyl aminopeptidase/acylaminoacyl peptidase